MGKGRGKLRRAYDVRNNPGAYILLCKPCHMTFDRVGARPAALRPRVYNESLPREVNLTPSVRHE